MADGETIEDLPDADGEDAGEGGGGVANVVANAAPITDEEIEAGLEALHCRWKDDEQKALVGNDETNVDALMVLLNRMGADSMLLEGVTGYTYVFERSRYGAHHLVCTSIPHVDPDETLPPDDDGMGHDEGEDDEESPILDVGMPAAP